MEKLNNLLDDVTIVNFKLLLNLAKRYSTHVLMSILLFLCLFSYFFFNQPVIYSSSLPVKVIGKHSLSSDQSVLQQVENVSSVSIGELSSMINSYSFMKLLATLIVEEPDFKKMNFGSIAKGNKVTGQDILNNCKSKTDCTIDSLVGYIGSFYLLEQGLTDDRFKLTVNTLDEKTSLIVSKALAKAIEKKRIQVRQYLVIKEINSVTNLLTESRELLEKQEGFSLIEEEEKNAQTILELKEKMRMLQSSLSTEIANMSALEAKLGENRKVLKKMKKVDGFVKTKSRVTQQKISDLRANIVTFSNIPEEKRTASDNIVLAQLKSELKMLEEKMPEESRVRTQEIEDAFGDSQRNKENDFKFDYMVSKNKVTNLEADYEAVRKELDERQKNKTAREALVSKYKSEIEFLKNLESKQLSLKLMNSTMTSDLQFEDPGKNISALRKISLPKTIAFSLGLTFFALVFSLIARYFLDDKIYSEDDITPYIEGLEFFGEAPTFE